MRLILGPVVAAGLLLLVSTSTARAQQSSPPILGRVLPVPPSMTPALTTSIYASDMLPESLSHPWVMVPRYSTSAPSLRFGDPWSPYGVYTRFCYYATGPYPGVVRPYVRHDKHWHD